MSLTGRVRKPAQDRGVRTDVTREALTRHAIISRCEAERDVEATIAALIVEDNPFPSEVGGLLAEGSLHSNFAAIKSCP